MKRRRQSMRKPNGADLREIAWSTLGGDPTDAFGYRHGGLPEVRDAYRVSKRQMFKLALEGNEDTFTAMADKLWNGQTRKGFYRSQRILIAQPGKKDRPLDLPPEWKRLVLIYVRERLTEMLTEVGGLMPTIVGFRSFEDFFYQKPTNGLTCQDLFAGAAITLLRKVGPYAVSVDLEEAFERLPHKAIHAALSDLGVCRDDRARIIDLVRITSKDPKHRERGIEQGGPLGPLIFNVVIDLLFRRLYRGSWGRAVSYGDDLILVAETHEQAVADFHRFVRIAKNLGFDNVRPLDGSQPKASRIYNTDQDPVPALKTFLISRSGIDLMPSCTTAFFNKKAIQPGDNRRTLRRKCKYKNVSTTFLLKLRQQSSQLLGGNPEVVGKPMDADPVGPRALECLDLVTKLEGVDPIGPSGLGGHDGLSGHVLPEVSLMVGSRVDGSSQSAHRRDSQSEGVYASRLNDVVIADRVEADLDVSAIFPPKGGNTQKRQGTGTTEPARRPPNGWPGGGTGCRSSSNFTVLPLKPDHLALLAEGRRVMAGTAYQCTTDGLRRRHVLDIRGLAGIPHRHLSYALLQALRLASTHGVAQVLVDPNLSHVNADALSRVPVPGWKLDRVREHQHGQVLTFRRPHPTGKVAEKPLTRAPECDLVVDRIRIDVANRRSVSVSTRGREHQMTRVIRVDTLTPRDAIRSSIAIVLRTENPCRVAVRSSGGLIADLIPKDAESDRPRTYRLVPLASAMQILLRWDWSHEGDWLIGVRRLG